MPTELEELVDFIVHPNPQIRVLAAEGLIPYSISQPSIFKADNLKPVENLKTLIKDHPKLAEHVLTILINLTGDQEILARVASDDKFLDNLLGYVVLPEEPNANLHSMLLANLAKYDGFKKILEKKQPAQKGLDTDELIVNQLLDLFVKGADGTYNKNADFDHLAYLFADLSKHAEFRQHFLKKQEYDGVIPLDKIKVFTEHKSDVRRKGVASTIKNIAFEIPYHQQLIADDEIDILPYILLPIMGSEEYDEDEMMEMLTDLQLLPPDKQRDSDPNIIQTHVETLLLLTTTKEVRDYLRKVKVYPIIRETHMHVENDGVQDACERLVQVLMRDDATAEEEEQAARVTELEDGEPEVVVDTSRKAITASKDDDDDDDNEIVEV
ncbi:uncharacterized protein B0I36DRAFT_318658 [Microdochium trichocladiopsis]|uniref:Protein HGH1 homolog n=1 Tax=Microdochium trichocladiopsis TaxID=1682393 RepID=A0A9P8YBS8_9PEZI|nr:uncharacterized protein B0I36DRAFT_318658 [Microdochium trichocladiopsis]KAH7035588.1 hypothetical protein B0I36DRAFT_318658 [Microdochium trichocladiopsis]